jgi:hypothetical protein
MARELQRTAGDARSEAPTMIALISEMIALRHQILVLKRSGTRRPCFRLWDRLFWILLTRWWPSWRDSLVIVQPATVLRWRRSGWSGLWHYRSPGRWRGGRPKIEREVRQLITRMARENFLWGAPRIHGELRMLGFSVSQATVSRYMPDTSRRPGQSWRTFLRNQTLAFRCEQDSENVSGKESRCLHAWFYPSRLGRLAVAQLALVGARRGRGHCGGSPLLLPNAQRISLRSVPYDRGVWHRAPRVSAVPGRSWRVARNRRQVTVSIRSPPHEARASPWPRLSATRASLNCINVLRTVDTPALQPSLPRPNSGFPRAD